LVVRENIENPQNALVMTKRSPPSNVCNVQHLDSSSEMARAEAAKAGGEV